MRYEDSSGAFQASGPIANDDADALAAGSRGPATGNLITGEGTQYGAAGADSAPGAHVAAIAGQGGEDSSFAGGKLSVSGQYGSLSVDAEGNYSYLANKGAPENVRDRFTYTLADNQGNTDTGALIVEIGKTPAVIKADAQQVIVGPDGVVTLPPGVELSDIMVVGRNLVVNMPDGTQLIIVDGAVFVPQLSLGGVEVPATNVAALLIGQEPQPAAGETPPSSGGNFALPPPPLDPGVPLGDLLPPTEYTYIPPEPQEVFDILDEEPEIFIQPDGQPAQVSAVDQVEEAGLPTRNGNLPNEPAGSGESADGNGADNDVNSEATAGTIIINSPDGVDSVTITGADGIPREIVVGLVVQGQFGALTITGIVGDDYTYSYVLRDNTSGDTTHDDFSVVLTDEDGDQAAATLRIDIIDDVPTARNDTDASVNGVATGNVMTDAAPGDAGDTDTNAADTVGADNATLTAVSGTGGSDSTFSGGLLNVNGTFGSLAIDAQGNYTYTVNPNAGGGGVDVFTYTLTDGDGDTTTATLTITNPDLVPNLPDPALIRLDDDVIPGAGGNPDGPNDDDPDVVGQNSVNGQLAGTGGDGDLDYAFTGSNTLPAGFTVNVVNAGQVQILQGGTVVMTITLDNETGAFTVVQNAPIDHPSLDGLAGDNTENNLDFSIGVQVVDVDGDVEPGAITINVDDDTPVVNTQVQLGGTVDEDGVLEGADDNGDGDGNPGGVNDVPGESTVVQGNVSALFSPGADQPLTFSLLPDTSGLPQGLTSNGAPVTYSVVGNTLTASANGQPVFTLTVNGTTGEYTFTLLDQLDHPSQDGIEGDDDTENLVDLTLALGSIIQATDADGDSVVAPANGLVITVDDDSPLPFVDCPEDVITVNQVGSTFTGELNLPPVGADEPGIVSFVVEDGDPVLDNEGNPVTSEGEALFYFVNDAGVLEARAGDATGDVIFTVTLNGDGTFTYEQVGVFGEGSEFTFDDLTSSAAGNVEFRGVGADDPATTVDLLLSAGPGDGITVNTDSDSIGSANQSMDVGETVRIDLVSDLTIGGGTPSGFSYGAHVSSSSFIGLIPQVQGSQDQTAAFTVWALDSSNTQASEPDRDPAGGFTDASITAVTEVTVKDYLTGESTTVDVTGFTVGVFTAVAYGVSARVNVDGSVTFAGIQQGDSYGFSTGSGDFNAVVVRSEPAGTGGSTQDSYDLGIFSIGIANEFDPFGLSIPIALTDSDGDAVICDIDVNVGVPLDAPEITVTVNEAGLPLIGSDSASNSEIASGDLQSQVSGGTGPYTFTLVSNGNGAFGNLVLNADGTFTYTLDTTFDSQPDANDGTNPELGAETFTFEATDSLGAKQTGTITVNIIDDVPSVDVTVNNEAAVLLTTQDADTIGVATDQDLTAVNFAGAFGIATVPGADGQQSLTTSYALAISNSVSGLSSNGDPINLYNVGGVIVGSTSGVNPGNLTDASIVFTIAVDANTGVVTLRQMQQIDHAPEASPLPGTGAPFDDQLQALADGKLTLTRTSTITDNDGDVDSDSAVIDLGGNIRFADHGPDAKIDVDEITSGGDTAEGNVITGAGTNAGTDNADVVGADVPGRVSGVVSVNEPGNTDQDPDPDVFEIDGEFGTLVLNADGSYVYTRFDGAPGNSQDVFTYTLVDFDGDTDTATLTINIGDAAPNLPDPAAILLDDDVIPGKNGNVPDGPGDDNPDVVGENVFTNGQLVGTGGDGTLTYNFTTDHTLPPGLGFSIGAASDADTLLIVQLQDGNPVTVMTIQLDQSDGSFTVTQNNPIRHPAAEGTADDDVENNLTFSIGVEVEDADEDVEAAHITITVDDDTPVVNVTKGADAAVLLTTDDAQTIGLTSDTAVSTANFSGVFGLAQSAGADGAAVAATLQYTLDVTGFAGGPAGVNSNLESHNVDIFLYEIGGKVVGSTSVTLAGVDATNTVFDVAVDGDGIVMLTQYQQIDHDTVDPSPTGPGFADHIVSLADGLVTLTASATLIDNDGDEVSESEVVQIGANLRFTDDGPDAATSVTAVGTVTLDESRDEGTDTPGGTLPNGLASAPIDFSVNFVSGGSVNYGADGAGSVSYALLLSGANVPSGLFALDPTDTVVDGDGYGQGGQIVLNQVDNVITGSFGGTDYFTLTMDPATGIVTFAQINPIWHPTPGASSFDEAATLNTALATNIQVVQTVTDFDGDTDTASINIGRGVFIIQDDGPQAIQPDAASLENEVGASDTADLDDDPVLSEVISDFGEDGPGLVRFANITEHVATGLKSGNVDIKYYLSDDGQTLEAKINALADGSGGTLIFTAQINQAAGTYTVTMAGTIDNGSGVTFNNLTSTKAGNVDVRGVGADDPLTAVDLLLTASANGANSTINTDSDSIGSDNQSMDQGETVRLDFVTNLETNAGLPSGFSYDGHVGTKSLLQTIPQVQGNENETVAFQVHALNTTVTDAAMPDDTPGNGFSDSTIVNTITHVTIDGYDVGQIPVTVALGAVGVWTTIAYGVSAQRQADGSVIFTGVQQGDQYGITTTTDFNAFAVTALPAGVGPNAANDSSTNSFDLGIFSIGQVDTGDPIDISFDLSITDADGDTVVMTSAIDITFTPATQSLQAPLVMKQAEVDKVAANSNSLTMATAVAAAGMADSAAAAPTSDPAVMRTADVTQASDIAGSAELSADGQGGNNIVAAMPEAEEADAGPGNSSGRGRGNDNAEAAKLDANSNQSSSDDGSAHQAANDQGPAVNAEPQVAAAPTVMMASAEQLQAAGLGEAKQNGSVEKLVAETIGNGDAPTVDGLLAHLPGGVAALAHMASQGAGSVPGWDMAAHGPSGAMSDMLMKVDVAGNHHDAIQPAVNG